MRIIGILFLAILATGCATSSRTGLISPMPDNLKKSGKDIDSVWQEWKSSYIKTRESRSGSLPTEYLPINQDESKQNWQNIRNAADETAKTIVAELNDYCTNHGGRSIQATCTPFNNFVTCEDSQKRRVNNPSWIDYFKYLPETETLSFSCIKGSETVLEVGVGLGLLYVPSRRDTPAELTIRTVSAQQRIKEVSLNAVDMDEYHLLKNPSALDPRKLQQLISRFEQKNDPENLIPTAKDWQYESASKRKESEQKAAIAQAAVNEQAAQLKRQEFTNTVNTGSLVCRTVRASAEIPILGKAQASTYKGNANLVGYVNQRANQKLQIQISAIHFRWFDESYHSQSQDLESLSDYEGSATLRVNGVIWDDVTDWEYCNK